MSSPEIKDEVNMNSDRGVMVEGKEWKNPFQLEESRYSLLQKTVKAQADDPALWVIEENDSHKVAYLQRALRFIHLLVEGQDHEIVKFLAEPQLPERGQTNSSV